MDNQEDGREKRRLFVKKRVIINNSIEASSIDISEGGMYIYTPQVFQMGSLIDITLFLKDEEPPLRGKAKIQHVHEGVGFGVMFLGLLPEERKKLKDFLLELDESPYATEKTSVKKILLIDDSDTARRMYKGVLMTEGYLVIEASSGVEGIKRLREGIPDLIVLDLIMEEMNGYQFLQLVRVTPEWKDIPVVVLTGRMTTAEMDKVSALGISDYLVKATTTPKKLAEKVNDIVKGISR